MSQTQSQTAQMCVKGNWATIDEQSSTHFSCRVNVTLSVMWRTACLNILTLFSCIVLYITWRVKECRCKVGSYAIAFFFLITNKASCYIWLQLCNKESFLLSKNVLLFLHREYRPMEQIDFQDNGTKVTAVNTKTYIFQRNMSRGPESDLIRTVNIPAMVSNSLQHRSDLPLTVL